MTILNPIDRRPSCGTLFNEIKGVHDLDRMATGVIPPQFDPSDEQWCAYARDVLADTMRKLVETNNTDQDRESPGARRWRERTRSRLGVMEIHR